ncbi:MAG: DNA/RNA nuclease SfsA [Oscillospiraceae bacterium]|nr:DNA/RNA nuclease SfsA [Oscillospiraceae bacterium]
MQYRQVIPARFIARPNRFVAHTETADGPVTVHVKNTGRCAELLRPGATVWLTPGENPARKTPYDLIAVEKPTDRGTLLINMDSAAPNAAAGEWLAAGGLGPLTELRAEYRMGASRFDFYARSAGTPMLVEVKGCTLEENGLARFPDAPTQRGLKHVQELTALAQQGWRCAVLIVIQMKDVHSFAPNWDTHPAFGHALAAAQAAGVEIHAVDCLVTPDSVTIDAPVPVYLDAPVR